MSLRGHIRDTVKVVFSTSDTTTIRLLLANASLLWAAGLLIDQDTFERSGYQVIRAFGGEYAWATWFLLHFVGVYWRLFDPRSRPNWALAVNTFGLFLWLTSTLSINIALGGFTTSTALEWTLCVASAWALFRTGLKKEVVTP
jgi:hypothetical protein